MALLLLRMLAAQRICDLIVLDGFCVIQVALKELPCFLVEFGGLQKSPRVKAKTECAWKGLDISFFFFRTTWENRPLLM